jgi:hypothetical protein
MSSVTEFGFTFYFQPFKRHGHPVGPDPDLPGDHRQRNPQFPVPRQQSPHEGGQANRSADDQQMDMIVYQCPGQNAGAGFMDQGPYSLDKGFSIFLILEYFASLDPPAHDRVQGPRDIQPRLSGHISLNDALNGAC